MRSDPKDIMVFARYQNLLLTNIQIYGDCWMAYQATVECAYIKENNEQYPSSLFIEKFEKTPDGGFIFVHYEQPEN